MFTAFMSDASNIMSFYQDEGDHAYSLELWIFKPQKSGQQVKLNLMKKYNLIIHFAQFAMMVIKTGDSFAEVDENIFNILLDMREMILPYEGVWRSIISHGYLWMDWVPSSGQINDHLLIISCS